MTREQKLDKKLMALERELYHAFWLVRLDLGGVSKMVPGLINHLKTVRVKLRFLSVILDEILGKP